jgi:hypothetical protein
MEHARTPDNMTKKLAKLLDTPGRRPGRPRTSARAELAREVRAMRLSTAREGLHVAEGALNRLDVGQQALVTGRDLAELEAAKRFLASLVGVARKRGDK